MRKFLAILLSLTLVFTFMAGCADTTTPSESPSTSPSESTPVSEEPSEAPSEEPAPENTVVESINADLDFQWNGKKEVWAIVPTINAEGLIMICDAMGEACEAEGWTYVKKDAELNPTNQVTYVEDAIASGQVGALMVAAMSTEILQDIVVEALEKGIIVVYLGAEPNGYTISGEVYTAYELTGMWAIEAAEEWARQNNPAADANGIPVAIDVYNDIQDGQFRSNAFVDRTNESDILYVYNTNTTYGDNAQTEGYNWAENQMTANPDLRIFICYEPDCAYGVCSYLETYAADNGIDLAEFCVICCYEDGDTPVLYEQALSDPSSTAFKGYITYGSEGGPPVIGTNLASQILAAADGTRAFGTYFYDDITSYTTFGFDNKWSMGDVNPAEKYKY